MASRELIDEMPFLHRQEVPFDAQGGYTKRRYKRSHRNVLRLLRMTGTLHGRKGSDMPATATPPERLLHPEPEEHDGFVALGAVLAAAANRQATTCVLGPNGENIELPATAFEALRTVVEAMANGQTVTLVPHHHELTTQQAADLLRISRPSLIKLLENDALPFRRVGTHRRVRIEDVLAYRETRAQQRRRELDELTALSEDLGYR